MLRIIPNVSAAGAKSYYSTADYYKEGQELTGVWRGEGAARLGLSGNVKQKEWDALCDNIDPATGKTLTQRQKGVRRVGYDFNFHVPKSVSLLHAMTGDERILEAFRESVEETMSDMEAEMKTRVRLELQNKDRTTGNMVFGEFIHLTSRPVGGVPDPHLHAHCFVFNTTWDDEESRWKAGQFADLKRDAPYFEAVFHSRLGMRLAELGLPVERTKKGWEIAGLDKPLLDKFSRRTALIEKMADELDLHDDRKKETLGATTRERKIKDLTMEELRREWDSRLTAGERTAIHGLAVKVGGPVVRDEHAAGRAAVEAATMARDHCFERKSVVPEREFLAQAIRRGVGVSTAKAVEAEVNKQDILLVERSGRRWVTTEEVLDEEKEMLKFARDGRGSCPGLGEPGATHKFEREWLNDGQRKAVLHVLNSPDRVILIRGAAGVGKTSMMKEAVGAVEANGTKVFTFAPSAEASRDVLRREGFPDADTVARLLMDEKLQDQIRGQVIWVDEAGLLGSKTTAELFKLAERIEARVILSGDRYQHGSVERGAALRLLETEAGLVPAEIREIQRQDGKYRQVVQALSEGHTVDGFQKLDDLGWIKEIPDNERYKAMANDYVAAIADGKTALVVSPTHAEGDKIVGEIRSELRRIGKLGKTEHEVTVLRNSNWTKGEREDKAYYAPDDVVIFHQNAKGHKKGERIVVGKDEIPLDQASKFQVFHADTLALASGDLVRITQNGKTADGSHRLNNGAIYAIKEFNDRGDIVLANGWTIGKDFGHLAYGFTSTSHASQGKSVDRVIIGQSSWSFPASSQEQFYVSVSRGRRGVTVYTDDKKALLDAVNHCDERLTATELLSGREHRTRAVTVQRNVKQLEIQPPPIVKEREREERTHG